MKREPELITVSSKGQVVIPQRLRHDIGITPKTKLLAYGEKDIIVLKKIKVPPMTSLDKIFKRIDTRSKYYRKLTTKEIQKEIDAYRREKSISNRTA